VKRFARFLGDYRLFSLALSTITLSLALTLIDYDTAAHWVLGTVAILELLPLLYHMWHDFRAGTYGIDILAATAIFVSVLLGQYWAAIVVVLMLTGGEALEDYAERRAHSELSALLKQAPKKARVVRKGKTLEVKASELHVGDKIIIQAGELVPADCVLTDGTASFDEASLTGESLPQVR